MATVTNPERVERLKQHRKEAREREFYAIQRIDLLVISVSGAGIYILFETLKFILEEELTVDRALLFWSGGLFTGAIMLNFISQMFGYRTNRQEVGWADQECCKEQNDPAYDQQKHCRHDVLAGIYSKWTRSTNILSTIAMAAGVILLVIFNFTFLKG